MSAIDTETEPEDSKIILSQLERSLCSEVLAAVRGIRYGSVQLVIHDGRVVEIQRVERIRTESRSS